MSNQDFIGLYYHTNNTQLKFFFFYQFRQKCLKNKQKLPRTVCCLGGAVYVLMLSTGGTGSQDVAAALVRLPGRADTTLGNSDIITCLKEKNL